MRGLFNEVTTRKNAKSRDHSTEKPLDPKPGGLGGCKLQYFVRIDDKVTLPHEIIHKMIVSDVTTLYISYN